MAEGDAASWFMLKRASSATARDDEMGFFRDTFINKAYLATYICIILFVVLSILLYKTRFGLRLRSCGENPQAADSPGHQRLCDALRPHHQSPAPWRAWAASSTLSPPPTAPLPATWPASLPGAGRYDLRQLETFEHRRRGPAVRLVQVHRRLLCQHRHQRRRRIPAGRARHQPPLLPDAALYYHAGRSGLHLQEVQGSQGEGIPYDKGKR